MSVLVRWRSLAISASLAGTVALAASSVNAHHSFAMFDQANPVELKGVVKSWEFVNPHSWLVMTVQREGQAVDFAIEGSSVNTLVRQGFHNESFMPGEEVTVVLSPLRDGRRGGAFVRATKADGTTLSMSPTPN
ncbi:MULTISPECIES: DUF6152 family protein [Chelativorans]|uniref:DUF5666 domain-containing protein n=1 Tax=Chelativorans sp. (strain BNC1) TaxID=266779 RepID=Q11EA3_CHESB|nr:MULTISPECIES: DUF6152 family protein [Chelativorans]